MFPVRDVVKNGSAVDGGQVGVVGFFAGIDGQAILLGDEGAGEMCD